MSYTKVKINNWEALIKWFDLVKNKAGIRVNDNFKIISGSVLIDGKKLRLYMIKFWLQEGLCSEDEWLRKFDLSDRNSRMRIKSHLVNFLDTHYAYGNLI